MTAPFIKGAAAQQAMQQEQAKADMRSNGTYRFYVKHGEERTITFLDGNLDANGLLDIPFIHEHRVKVNGSYENIACTEPNEACPLCDMAKQSNSQDYGFSAFIGYLTVIDHTGYVDNNGVQHADVIRLYAAKRKTIELLTKMAQNSGTLAGMSFKVSRSSDKSAAVGDIYVPVGQYNVVDLINYYKQQDPNSKIGVLNYDKEVTYFDANTLRGMLGMGNGLPNGGAPNGQPTGLPQQQQYSHQNGAGGMPQMQPAMQQSQMPNSAAPPLLNQNHEVPPQKKFEMLATDYTLDQYKQSGWNEDQLVAAGKARWVQPEPVAPAPMQQAAPEVKKVLQMIATDFTHQQYKDAGWQDDMLVAKGKAQWVEQASAPAPMQQAPEQAPAPNMPFSPNDCDAPDTNTNYAGQL
ncbi:hypothetical protein ACRXCV_00030 (plasmid) [Halobacteriovorax sp. GFR7]|uniref:hypothetical protein n=1 Tax=unclassified Halobacteriovorax TaxID=2639665 RepID=UPI003D996A73